MKVKKVTTEHSIQKSTVNLYLVNAIGDYWLLFFRPISVTLRLQKKEIKVNKSTSLDVFILPDQTQVIWQQD